MQNGRNKMKIYKGYKIVVVGSKVFVSLNGESVGTAPFHTGEKDYADSVQGAMEWIDEDIRCRKEDD